MNFSSCAIVDPIERIAAWEESISIATRAATTKEDSARVEILGTIGLGAIGC